MRSAARIAAALASACLAQACAQAPVEPQPGAPARSQPPSQPSGQPQPRAEATGPLAGFGWFAELGGACWKGDHPDGKTSDTQCYLAQYGRLMRGSIKIMREGVSVPVGEGDAVFAMDPTGDKRVVYTQWGAGGVYALGVITFEGDTLVFRNKQPDGSDSPIRSTWRRTGADGYRVVRERQGEDGAWREFLAVDYRRVR